MGQLDKTTLLQKIEMYLQGEISKKDISQWAIKTFQEKSFRADELLLEDTVTALSLLHDEDTRLDTAREDLVHLQDCLKGKIPYGVKMKFIPSEKELVGVVRENRKKYK